MRGRTNDQGHIRLRADVLKDVAQARGWYTTDHIAAELDLARSSVSRVLRDKQVPGSRFIAAVLRRFPQQDFEDFFEVTGTPDQDSALRRVS